jgi:hypothetical protein
MSSSSSSDLIAPLSALSSSESSSSIDSSLPPLNQPLETSNNSLDETPLKYIAYGNPPPLQHTLCIDSTDLHSNMLAQQSLYVTPSTYSPAASYLPFRRYLVDWMSDIGDNFGLHPTTIHVSILYLDKILRGQAPIIQPPPRAQWQLLATACISCAAKYEEAEEHCPNIPELLDVTKLSHQGVTPLSFRADGELEVLKYLFWTLRAVPALHFINLHLAQGCLFESPPVISEGGLVAKNESMYEGDLWQGRTLIDKLPKYLKKYCEFFANLCMQDYSFQQFYPSELAASIIMASRRALQITPLWHGGLEHNTGYSEDTISECYAKVWGYYEEQFPGHGGLQQQPGQQQQGQQGDAVKGEIGPDGRQVSPKSVLDM